MPMTDEPRDALAHDTVRTQTDGTEEAERGVYALDESREILRRARASFLASTARLARRRDPHPFCPIFAGTLAKLESFHGGADVSGAIFARAV